MHRSAKKRINPHINHAISVDTKIHLQKKSLIHFITDTNFLNRDLSVAKCAVKKTKSILTFHFSLSKSC